MYGIETNHDATKGKRTQTQSQTESQDEWLGDGDVGLLSGDYPLEEVPRMCCLRACPLVCTNQDLVGASPPRDGRLAIRQVEAIKPIYDMREFDELSQKNSNILSYRRSISVG